MYRLLKILFVLFLFTEVSYLYSFDYFVSTKAMGMGGACSLAGNDNGVINGNPAGVANTHTLSLGSHFYRNTDDLNTSYLGLSMVDSLLNPNLAGGLIYTRFFNDGEGNNKLKLEDIYFELAEHYTEFTYIGLGVRRIRNFNPYDKLYDMNFGVIVKFNEFFSIGVAGYNLLNYQSPFFRKELEFSAAFSVMDMVNGEVDISQDFEDNRLNGDETTVKAGVEVILLEQIGIQAGYNRIESTKNNIYSGGLSWDFPKGAVGYALRYNDNDKTFSHLFMIQLHPEIY